MSERTQAIMMKAVFLDQTSGIENLEQKYNDFKKQFHELASKFISENFEDEEAREVMTPLFITLLALDTQIEA